MYRKILEVFVEQWKSRVRPGKGRREIRRNVENGKPCLWKGRRKCQPDEACLDYWTWSSGNPVMHQLIKSGSGYKKLCKAMEYCPQLIIISESHGWK